MTSRALYDFKRAWTDEAIAAARSYVDELEDLATIEKNNEEEAARLAQAERLEAIRERAIASAAPPPQPVIRNAATPVPAIDPRPEVAEPSLSILQQNILMAMVGLSAFDSDSRRTIPVIAKATAPKQSGSSFSGPIADLAFKKLVSTREGRGGGCWLTELGKIRAEKI